MSQVDTSLRKYFKSIGDVAGFASTLLLTALLLQSAAKNLKSEISSAGTSAAKESVTFAQITDAHIFDDGWKAKGAEPYEFAMDNRAALNWVVESIRVKAAEGGIDFVVYSGDFGLQNVFFRDPACGGVPFKAETGLGPFSAELAAREVALEFDRLPVHDLYVVAGNNDIVDEQVVDYPRFECFVAQLQKELQMLPGNVHVEILRPDRAVSFGKFRLAGLNTASFKKSKNYENACAAAKLTAALEQGCPGPQIGALHGLLNGKDKSPLLLFTHIPDLLDPLDGKTKSWELDAPVLTEWMMEASNPELLGVFAGHFHSFKRELYATTSGTQQLFVNTLDGEKTYVTPPLAGKYQRDVKLRDGGPQARGYMWVSIGASGGGKLEVNPKPVWYEAPSAALETPAVESAVAEKGEREMSQQCFFLLVVLVIVIAGCFGGVLNYLLRKKSELEKPDPDEPSVTANLVLGVGAAFLVPLFLHVIGSNLVDQMHHGMAGQPDYAIILVFGGFCLVASMSARSFISNLSDRVLKKAENAQQVAEEAKQETASMKAELARFVQSQGEKPSPPAAPQPNQGFEL